MKLLLLVVPLLFNEVKCEQNWYYNNANNYIRKTETYDEKIYFPGKTNEEEVNIKRLNNVFTGSNSFTTENESNRIDDINFSTSNTIREIYYEVTTSSPRRTSTIRNTKGALNPTQKPTSFDRVESENVHSSSSLINRVTKKNRNTSEEYDQKRTIETSSTSSRRRKSERDSEEEIKTLPTSSLLGASIGLISTKLRVCERKYAEYIQRIFPEETDTANDANDSEFDGRVLAAPGEYPHMTALGFLSKIGKVDYKCGGSLISERFVITAAHCTNLTGLLPHKVRIGDLNLKVEENYLKPQIREIKKIYVHPGYKKNSYYNDIALLELEEDVELTEFVRPIRLWTQHTIPFKTAYTMGYGATAFAKEFTYRLTNLNMTLLTNDVCNSEMPELPESERGIIESQICAKDYELNRDTCQGDSGGPLQLNIKGRRRRTRLHYLLIGITSYGLYCRSGYPSIFTRVSSFLDWIEHIVWKEDFD